MAISLQYLVFLLTCGLLFSMLVPSTADFLTDEFKKWMKDYKVTYSSQAEELQRFAIFKANYVFVSASNQNPKLSFTLSLNEFAAMTNEEFLAKHTGYNPLNAGQTSTSFRYGDVTAPSSIDWRYLGAVTEVKNQGQCGEYCNVLQLVLLWVHHINSIIILLQDHKQRQVFGQYICSRSLLA
jgi:Cathepsin propeptide inhibitor domain (I29)